MQKTKAIIVSIGFVLVLFIAATAFLQKAYDRSGTEFILSENRKQLTIETFYQADKTRKVHSYIRRELNLDDFPDLSRVEVKNYHTNDGVMTFSLKSRKRSLKIVLDKRLNSEDAYLKMKKLAGGLEKLLTR